MWVEEEGQLSESESADELFQRFVKKALQEGYQGPTTFSENPNARALTQQEINECANVLEEFLELYPCPHKLSRLYAGLLRLVKKVLE